MHRFFNHGLITPRNMGHYRLPTLFIDPPMLCVITAGLGHMQTLKRVAVARFTTSYQPLSLSAADTAAHVNLRWTPDILPDFLSSVKLYIDFPAPDLLHATAGFQQVAVKFGGHMPSFATRSLGDSGRCKRRTLTITFPPGFNTEDPAFFDLVGDVIQARTLFVLVGWEDLWQWPEDAYLITVDDLTLLNDLSHYQYLAQGVVKSRSEILVTLHPDKTAQNLIEHMQDWNSSHTQSGFKKLENSSQERVWERQGQLSAVPSLLRPDGAPAYSSSDFQICFTNCDPARLVELWNHFLRASSSWYLGEQKADPSRFTYTLHTKMTRTQMSNKALVTGVPLTLLRGWYWHFKDYAWTNTSGQTIGITLTCPFLDEEMMKDSTLRRRAAANVILPIADSLYVDEHGTMPPPALPAPPASSSTSSGPSSSQQNTSGAGAAASSSSA